MLDTVTTSREVRSALQNARIITATLPGFVPGEMSPYPMVVCVTTVNQMDSKKESKSGYFCILKYGFSKMRMR